MNPYLVKMRVFKKILKKNIAYFDRAVFTIFTSCVRQSFFENRHLSLWKFVLFYRLFQLVDQRTWKMCWLCQTVQNSAFGFGWRRLCHTKCCQMLDIRNSYLHRAGSTSRVTFQYRILWIFCPWFFTFSRHKSSTREC